MVSIFLSRPRPHELQQEHFLEGVCTYLRSRLLEPRTIGHTDYGLEPLRHIRGVLRDCNGLLAIAFRRIRIDEGWDRPTDEDHTAGIDFKSQGRITGAWMSSPYCQIETSMAFQMGLPILVIAEKGIRADGVLEGGVLTGSIPTFDLTKGNEAFLESLEWRQLVYTWEGQVREVVARKGRPPELYTE